MAAEKISAGQSQSQSPRPSRNHISQRENHDKMKKLVTADAVKSALRTEEVAVR